MESYRKYTPLLLTLSILIFSLGFISAAIHIDFNFSLDNILTLAGWLAAVGGAWWVTKKQLILRHTTSAVKAMMKSNRDLTQPLTDLSKIVSFEMSLSYYEPINSQSLRGDLADIHDKLRLSMIQRTQAWEEHRISIMPTENEFLFIQYLLDDLREDLFDILSENHSIAMTTSNMNSEEYRSFLENNMRFKHLQKLCIDVIVFSLDYGNLIQNKYLRHLFKTLIPDRKPLDGSFTIKDYDVRSLVLNYQKRRDEYFLGKANMFPRFYSLIR